MGKFDTKFAILMTGMSMKPIWLVVLVLYTLDRCVLHRDTMVATGLAWVVNEGEERI